MDVVYGGGKMCVHITLGSTCASGERRGDMWEKAPEAFLSEADRRMNERVLGQGMVGKARGFWGKRVLVVAGPGLGTSSWAWL